MKKTPLLTIGIPTYNSADYLKQTLDNVIAQITTDEIEIVISDNGSTDTTQTVACDYAEKFNYIKYFRNENNQGPDNNFDLVVTKATGRYVWLFGDDDQITHQGLDTALSIVRKDETYTHIFISYAEYDQNLAHCTHANVLENEMSAEFNDHKSYLQRVAIAPIFMSSNIFLRSAWLQVNKQAYIGSGWIHYAVFLESVINKKTYCIGQPLVKLRRRATWTSGGKIWTHHITLGKILKKMPSMGYAKPEVDYLKKKHLADIQITFVNAKRSGLVTTKALCIESIELYYSSWKFWIIIAPLALLPNNWVTALWVLSKKTRQLCKRCVAPSHSE